jgi:DNA-binding transcriptional MocR family regulator
VTREAAPAPAAPASAALILCWAHGTAHERTAAAILRQIASGRLTRWSDLPPLARLAEENDVSERTVSKAKRLLAGHGALVKQVGRYYVSLPAPASRPPIQRPPRPGRQPSTGRPRQCTTASPPNGSPGSRR